jgi:hypothetical protein
MSSFQKLLSLGLTTALLLLTVPLVAQAAALTYSADTSVAIGANNYVILSGSEATTVTIGSTTLTVTVPSGSTFTFKSPDRFVLPNSANLPQTCSASDNILTVAGPQTSLVITPDPTTVCTVSASGGGGGGGGGPAPAPNPAPNPTPPPTNNPPGLQQAPSYPVGTLVQQGGTIYLITEAYTAVGFTNWNAFVGLGYQLRYVISDNLPGYRISTTYFLSSPTQSHPWSAWVISGHTVYYVSPQGLIGVPSWDIFLSNGGQDKYIVPINKADLQVLKDHSGLAVLQPNDSRVTR